MDRVGPGPVEGRDAKYISLAVVPCTGGKGRLVGCIEGAAHPLARLRCQSARTAAGRCNRHAHMSEKYRRTMVRWGPQLTEKLQKVCRLRTVRRLCNDRKQPAKGRSPPAYCCATTARSAEAGSDRAVKC
jgi:hypothetical protein